MRVGSVRGPVIPASLVVLLLALLGLAGKAEHHPVDKQVQVSAAAAAFLLKGNVSGLFPGSRRRLPVTVTNPHPFRIRVTSLSVRVNADLRRPGCAPGEFIRVSRANVPFTVRPRSNGLTTLYMSMVRAATKDCRRAEFPLVFSAQARRP